ncbi:MAG: Maf family protein [Chloroflexota bacterium]|nr:Maf family protein [Chloroflexota bacterium]
MLASASPRRQVLIGLLGLPWQARPADVDEAGFVLREPVVSALNIALMKARRVQPAEDGEVIVAADTIVASDDRVLGKPADAVAATRMLAGLRGRTHDVVTGVALRTCAGLEWGAVVATRVIMRSYADAEIAAYVERGEPFDKAGGYAVQDAQFRPAERLEGCYLNVVGLPLCAVAAGLNALGVATEPAAGAPPCQYCRAGAPRVAIGAQDTERSP